MKESNSEPTNEFISGYLHGLSAMSTKSNDNGAKLFSVVAVIVI